MAEKKISQLTAKGATVADTDLLVISESAGGGVYNTKSVTGANIKALVTDANMTTTDITTNNVSTSKHGFAPKAPNDATKFLDGTGAYDTVKDSDLSLSDVTTNDVSTTKHGFVPKAPNDSKKYLDGTGAWTLLPVDIQLAASDETTALTTGTAKVTFRMPYAMTVTAVRASLSTAQASGSIFTVDINESGTSILSTKLTIDNTEKTSTTAAKIGRAHV